MKKKIPNMTHQDGRNFLEEYDELISFLVDIMSSNNRMIDSLAWFGMPEVHPLSGINGDAVTL